MITVYKLISTKCIHKQRPFKVLYFFRFTSIELSFWILFRIEDMFRSSNKTPFFDRKSYLVGTLFDTICNFLNSFLKRDETNNKFKNPVKLKTRTISIKPNFRFEEYSTLWRGFSISFPNYHHISGIDSCFSPVTVSRPYSKPSYTCGIDKFVKYDIFTIILRDKTCA